MTEDVLAHDIADRLRRDILRGVLAPGTTVKERDHAAALGVSRTPMREAIRILANERLIQLRPSRSPVVADPSADEVADEVLVLITLEKLSAELACRKATDADLDDIRAHNDRMQALYDSIEYLDLFELDMGFHAAIARASHNASLAETHRTYLGRLWRARFLSAKQKRNRERVKAHHDAIVEALAARDIQAVRAAIDSHLGQLTDDIRAALADEQAARPETHRRSRGKA